MTCVIVGFETVQHQARKHVISVFILLPVAKYVLNRIQKTEKALLTNLRYKHLS